MNSGGGGGGGLVVFSREQSNMRQWNSLSKYLVESLSMVEYIRHTRVTSEAVYIRILH